MTAKRTISLTDPAYERAKALVDSGRFASLSAVLQHGLHLIEREEAEHQARLAAIREDLRHRADGPMLSIEAMEERLEQWRSWRDSESTDGFA